MAFHKKEEFGKKDQELAQFAKALSHPARIAILKVLAEKSECICGEGVASFKRVEGSRSNRRHAGRATVVLLHQLESV